MGDSTQRADFPAFLASQNLATLLPNRCVGRAQDWCQVIQQLQEWDEKVRFQKAGGYLRCVYEESFFLEVKHLEILVVG